MGTSDYAELEVATAVDMRAKFDEGDGDGGTPAGRS